MSQASTSDVETGDSRTFSRNTAALRARCGQEIAVSDWLCVSQELIDAFAAATGDRQWIHVDPARARSESPYGATIAHGFLTLSLISRLHGQAVQIEDATRVINYGLNRVRFPAPVRAGARVRTRSTLLAVDDVQDAVQFTWKVTVEAEGQDRPAMVAEWVLRCYPGGE
jgi:acyl dehydratase